MSDVRATGERATFVLELRFGRDGPLVGTIRRAESDTSLSFHGWIALMQAIDRLLGGAAESTDGAG